MIPFIPGRFKLENFQVGALMYFCRRSGLQNKFFEFLLAVLHRSFELLYRIAETLIAISEKENSDRFEFLNGPNFAAPSFKTFHKRKRVSG